MQAQAHSLAPEATACKNSKPDPLDLQIPGVYTLMIPSAGAPLSLMLPQLGPYQPGQKQTLQCFSQIIHLDQHFMGLVVLTHGFLPLL